MQLVILFKPPAALANHIRRGLQTGVEGFGHPPSMFLLGGVLKGHLVDGKGHKRVLSAACEGHILVAESTAKMLGNRADFPAFRVTVSILRKSAPNRFFWLAGML
jgi:hypothetical protein